jgi:DNA-binding NtrC family response regulator
LTSDLDAYCVFTFGDVGTKQDDWLEIGTAVPHADGDGLSVTLQALPFEGRLIVRKREVQKQQIANVPLEQQVEVFERAVIERCLLESAGRINVVMERLSLPRRTLNEKMSRLGIRRQRLRAGSSK